MIDPEAISDAKRALGRQLAACRDAAGFKQQELAPVIHYGRSTIATAETGYSACSRTFWERCDHVLGANGALLRGYDELNALIRSQRTEVARLMEHRRAAKLRQLTASVGPDQPRPEDTADTVMLTVRLEGREVIVPLDRRLLLQAGVGTFLEAFALGSRFNAVDAAGDQPTPGGRVAVTSPAHVEEILDHLREQWHTLVRTDNLFGPRHALAGVLSHVAIVEGLLPALRDDSRRQAVQLGARYAESAAWLYEDSGRLPQARYWTSRAMEWAYEADDRRMLAWTVFRRSQQAVASRDAAQVVGLARAARRDEPQLAPTMRAAIRVQEAHGHALDGDVQASQRLLDDAHTWAAVDTVGDARGGHGSYCTPSYIELQRASCWLTLGQPKKALRLYERALPSLPVVYQRDRAAALSRMAAAYVAAGQPDQAAATARAALPVARGAGSNRIVDEITSLAPELAPHRALPGVAALFNDLEHEGN